MAWQYCWFKSGQLEAAKELHAFRARRAVTFLKKTAPQNSNRNLCTMPRRQIEKESKKNTQAGGLFEVFHSSTGPRVLLVDGNPRSRRALARGLTAQGYAVVEMTQKTEFFEYLGQPLDTFSLEELPELIIADLDLFDGATHLDRVRYWRKANRVTPVILLARDVDIENALEASQLGAVYLFKKGSPIEGLLCAANTLVPPW